MKLLLAFCLWLIASTAFAESDADLTASWFNALAPADKLTVQMQLTLTQEYGGLIDGKFGQATYNALVKFQSDHGFDHTGLLRQEALDLLSKLGRKAFDDFGIEEVDDASSGLGTIIPKAILSSRTTSEGKTATKLRMAR